jgi:hypothetical protein
MIATWSSAGSSGNLEKIGSDIVLVDLLLGVCSGLVVHLEAVVVETGRVGVMERRPRSFQFCAVWAAVYLDRPMIRLALPATRPHQLPVPMAANGDTIHRTTSLAVIDEMATRCLQLIGVTSVSCSNTHCRCQTRTALYLSAQNIPYRYSQMSMKSWHIRIRSVVIC